MASKEGFQAEGMSAALRSRPTCTHLLVALFGMGSWLSINSLWVELPVVVRRLPEGWNLPAYLTVLVALGNVGPLSVSLAHRLAPGRLKEQRLILAIQAGAIGAALLLALFWDCTATVAGEPHSLAFLLLSFLMAVACCSSNVCFLPFMSRFPRPFLHTFFLGQGLGALCPCLLALGQGVGRLECLNATQGENASSRAHYLQENFSASTYFWLLVALLLLSALAFLALLAWPGPPPERNPRREGEKEEEEESHPLHTEGAPPLASPAESTPGAAAAAFWTRRTVYLLGLLGVSNALSNGVLPALQSYSCLPYGNRAYHLSVVFSNLANPIACLLAMGLLCRSSLALALISAAGGASGAYLVMLAALSPCPPLRGTLVGIVLVVAAWILFVGFFSYLKVVISSLLHEAGHAALLWCGAVIQGGSLVGALTMFPLTSIYRLFQSGRDCVDSCG